jgi:hypothetical protein
MIVGELAPLLLHLAPVLLPVTRPVSQFINNLLWKASSVNW